MNNRNNMNVDTLPNVHTARSEVSMFNALRDSTPSAMLLILVVKIYRLSYEAHYIVAEQLFQNNNHSVSRIHNKLNLFIFRFA